MGMYAEEIEAAEKILRSAVDALAEGKLKSLAVIALREEGSCVSGMTGEISPEFLGFLAAMQAKLATEVFSVGLQAPPESPESNSS